MIEKGKISALQMSILMYPTIIATAILLVPSITMVHAGRDMWLSPIWASFSGVMAVFLAVQLNKIYPKETIIEYIVHIIGRIPGKGIGLLYLCFYLHVNGIIIREYGEFVVGTFLPYTPMYVVTGSIVLVCSFAVRGGLEVLGRTSQIFIPVVIVLFGLIVILLIPDLDPKKMLPLFEHGLVPSLKGSVILHSWFSEFILIAFMLPYLSDRKKGLKWGVWSVVAISLTMVITNLASLFLFGDSLVKLTYPVMVAARYISVAEFLSHVESIIMAIWVAGTFVKISVFYYVLVIGTAQWLKLSNYRPIVLPLGFMLALFSIWSAGSLQELGHFLSTSAPFYLLSVQILVPSVLLIIAYTQKKVRQKNKKEPSSKDKGARQ
jgi:spore germination protein KB